MTIDITAIALSALFGDGCSQTASTLTFNSTAGLSPEGILVELLVRLVNLQSFDFELESGGLLETETGKHLSGSIAFQKLTCFEHRRSFIDGYEVVQLVFGMNWPETLYPSAVFLDYENK